MASFKLNTPMKIRIGFAKPVSQAPTMSPASTRYRRTAPILIFHFA